MARLHADEDFSLPVVERLRQLGHDVSTAAEAGMANQRIPDADVLAHCTVDARAVLTFNRRHSKRQHTTIPTHGRIIICTRDDDIDSLAARIDDAIRVAGALKSQLVMVNKPP